MFLPARAMAGPVTLFSTGGPDGKMATLSSPAGPGVIGTETADGFVLGEDALISGATFVGLLPVVRCSQASTKWRLGSIVFLAAPLTRLLDRC